MKEFGVRIRVAGSPVLARLRFGSDGEIRRYHRSLASSGARRSNAIDDAIEFTRLAAKRWRYYRQGGDVAESVAELRRRLERARTCEVAFIVIASFKQGRRDLPLGLAYCRRTWCHHLALDFLALHPAVLVQSGHITGVGSGIMFGLVQLATRLNILRIWGEATVSSASFYERLLGVRAVKDLFIIEEAEMSAIAQRQEKLAASGTCFKTSA